ncbi:MAG: insulinase family protein, partial [Planctomycetota bacterium]
VWHEYCDWYLEASKARLYDDSGATPEQRRASQGAALYGLEVILHSDPSVPLVAVDVWYHVGSGDEEPGLSGFAHLFEHMMFRGSANVPSEEHMRLINGVGGSSNAFTSFDQTTYVNTVPANALQMALWLEADRMASFRVNDEVFATERDVVAEEYNQRVANPPYGRLFLDFFDLAFEQSHYSWTPIGNMEQLRAASSDELQDFFDLFYVPKNAVLAIAGDFDVDEAKQWTRDYYGWIPAGQDVPRRSPQEPTQSETKRKVVYAPAAPLTQIAMGFKTPKWADDDNDALQVAALVLGQGRSSRLYRALVAGEDGAPVAAQASSGNQELEDGGLLFATVVVLPGQNPDDVEAKALEVIARFAEEGPTDDELAKAKTQLRLQLLRGRQTADSIATTLAEAHAFGGDVELANTTAERIAALTVEDVKRVAQSYLDETRVSILQYRPGTDPNVAPSDAAAQDRLEGAQGMDGHGRDADSSDGFPANYPMTAPVPQDVIDADFSMGESIKVGAMNVVVISDDRIPLVGMTLLLPGGGDSVTADKLGLAGLTADLTTRGVGELDAAAFSELLESRGIALVASDGGDHTRLSGSLPKAELATVAKLAGGLLAEPVLPANEFANLQRRALAGLQQQLSNPPAVAARELSDVLFGQTPQGRSASLATMQAITLEDIRQHHAMHYNLVDATLILAGDITTDEAKVFAQAIIDAFAPDSAAFAAPEPDYTLPLEERQVVLVDNPGGRQSAVRLGGRAFTIDSDDKWAASVAAQILSGGIESRLNRSLRAEKGLTYGASGRFAPGRH